MFSRAGFIPWYHVVRSKLGGLVADLSDVEVMEYVSGERILTIPLSQIGDEARPMPVIEIESLGDALLASLTYNGMAEIKHLKNILNPNQAEAQKELRDALLEMKPAVEVRLYKRGFKEFDYVFVKKYVASKLDMDLLRLLIVEAEAIGMGGRQAVAGRMMYEPPATPKLHLLFAEVKADDGELGEVLRGMRRVVACVADVKTVREMIHSRISKPVEKVNDYRAFSVLLNEARGLGLISAEERRGLDKRWRDVAEERVPMEEDLRRRVDESK